MTSWARAFRRSSLSHPQLTRLSLVFAAHRRHVPRSRCSNLLRLDVKNLPPTVQPLLKFPKLEELNCDCGEEEDAEQNPAESKAAAAEPHESVPMNEGHDEALRPGMCSRALPC